MIDINDIPKIMESINNGGEKPEGVEVWDLSRDKKFYTVVLFEGLGMFRFSKKSGFVLVTQEEINNIRNAK